MLAQFQSRAANGSLNFTRGDDMSYLGSRYNLEEDVGMPEASMASAEKGK